MPNLATLGLSLGCAQRPEDETNQRNGKTVLTGDGPIRLGIPRDRNGSFSPILIPKHERRYTGFDDKIIAMYARGMTVREIRAFLSEQYGTDVSPDFISSVTDEVMEEISAWQQRPLEPMYPVIFSDALLVRPIYQAINAEAAEHALGEFENGPWGKQYPTVVAAWRRAWDRVIPFFVFPSAIRKVNYTTNAIESINAQLRKVIKTRGHFPNDDAATNLIWLGLRNITANWGSAAHDWKSAMNQFAILYGDRFIRSTW